MTKLNSIAAGVLLALCAATALAAASAEEAKQLGTTLTAFGAEKAGNADGSIPAYTGGLSTPPEGHKPGGPTWENPYKADKPLFSIDAKNMGQYAELLTAGTKALLERTSTFRVDVYPTRRTMYYPQWVLDNTLKNATTAKLVGKVEGDGVEGAFGGIPFPIPKNGYEVMWNSNMQTIPVFFSLRGSGYLVDSSGGMAEMVNATSKFNNSYYDKTQTQLKDAFYYRYCALNNSPITQAGTVICQFFTSNEDQQELQSWLYSPGQRRVRIAPEFKYDTPIAQTGGAINYDELKGFSGRMDRFSFALKGKKEFIIPYNSYDLTQAPAKDVVSAKHLKPEAVRWERHRVWVVEATVKPTARHAFSRRTYYIDEDSWAIDAVDAYDTAGKLQRVYYGFPIFFYEKNLGGFLSRSDIWYDLLKGNYYMNNFGTGVEPNHVLAKEAVENPQQFTPAGISGAGVR